jgi:hypothetical protein
MSLATHHHALDDRLAAIEKLLFLRIRPGRVTSPLAGEVGAKRRVGTFP